ncbi:hypothetical protein D0B54_02160 [Solimonas sp. K1W22B-7]|uniref:hypothetical protein n=1 Tax=Solimonas sp. K1W22B-7 TaxID=2303331 RepID=UPI000E32EC97|nr:hypothetical protein [Solimonas sp. K1W22B-7]AXQ27553.1 hypothetical protein D0B54_02160 [Solimonas sp. K1W22B-7]
MKALAPVLLALLALLAAPAGAAPAPARSPGEIQGVFDRNRAPLQRILLKYQQRMPLEQVLRLELRFTIAPDGQLSEPAVQSSTYGDRELEAMLLNWLRGLRFEARPVPAQTVERYPLLYPPVR